MHCPARGLSCIQSASILGDPTCTLLAKNHGANEWSWLQHDTRLEEPVLSPTQLALGLHAASTGRSLTAGLAAGSRMCGSTWIVLPDA